MDAVKFLKEKNRMMLNDSDAYKKIKNFPLVEAVVDYVEEWSRNHPVKTRLQDFKEKYPNNKIEQNEEYEHVCCEVVGYCEKCKYEYDAAACKDCWNEPV